MVEYELINCKTALNISCKDKYLDATINPYIGCYHSCKYCYVQSEKYRQVDSPEELFNKVKVKTNIVERFIKEIAKYKEKCYEGVIYLGSSSDPYQPIENEFKLSHKIVEIILKYTPYKLHIFTKSKLVLNDIDLFQQYNSRVAISVSLITVLEKTKNIFEPNSSSVEERLYCISELNKKGINTGCAIMPILPYITDSDEQLTELISTLSKFGSEYIWWGYLTLRENITKKSLVGQISESQKEVYYKVLEKHFPQYINEYRILYKNHISPDKKYQKLIDKKIFYISKKYKISFRGPQWSLQNKSLSYVQQLRLMF